MSTLETHPPGNREPEVCESPLPLKDASLAGEGSPINKLLLVLQALMNGSEVDMTAVKWLWMRVATGDFTAGAFPTHAPRIGLAPPPPLPFLFPPPDVTCDGGSPSKSSLCGASSQPQHISPPPLSPTIPIRLHHVFIDCLECFCGVGTGNDRLLSGWKTLLDVIGISGSPSAFRACGLQGGGGRGQLGWNE